MGKDKNGKKRTKESQLAIRVAKTERDTFVKLCDDMDTTAAREIRRFMREFVVANSGAPVAADDGAEVLNAEAPAEAASGATEAASEAQNAVGGAPLETALPVEKNDGKASKKKHKK